MTDILEIIKQVNDLYDEDVITTASKINRPEPKKQIQEIEAINEFMRRNPKADGGQLVAPSIDGSRPGYSGDVNLYEKYGKKEIDKAVKQWAIKSNKEPNRVNKIKITTFDNLNASDKNNFKKKYLDDIEKYGEWNPNRKIDSRQKRVLKEQGIQIKLLEATNKKGKFNAAKFAKDNNITMKFLKEQSNLLQGNIYDKRMLVSGKDMGRSTLTWIPEDATISDNALSKLHKSGLIIYERNKIDELFYDAFGRKKIKGTDIDNLSFNNKKYLAIKNNLNEYRQLKKAINLKYPSINFELDHPLAKSTLNKLFNASADELTRVNILDAELNNNFKKSLSSKYENAISSKNLKAKKAIDKIAKDLNLNIGKVTQNLTGYDYGVKEFQKLNIKDEIIKSVKNQKDLNLNFKNYIKKNPGLLKIAGYTTKDIEKLPFTKITKITDTQISGIVKMLNIKSKDNAATIASKIKKAPIPSKFKSLLLPIVATGGAVTGADFLKKSGILFDKEFEPTASADVPPLVAEGLSTGEKAAIGTGTAGAYKFRKPIMRAAGKTLSALTGPLPIAGMYAIPGFGIDLKSSIDRSILGAELAFAPSLVKQSAKFRPAIQKLLNFGLSPKMAMRAARIANPIGIASLVGEGLYHLGKKGYDQYQLMKGMTESEKSDYLADQYEDLGGVYGEGAADGGLIGDKSGPAPTGGPMSQGLRSLYNNGRKL